jgi:acyl-[acyl carrier protein]--UDP-N-acetylglucosamine O-acyltransferase
MKLRPTQGAGQSRARSKSKISDAIGANWLILVAAHISHNCDFLMTPEKERPA